ncbi:MAG TPA: PAS domain S-box protein [Methanomassiliicoccales archaeon]
MPEPQASSIRILVVDDETTLLEIAREFLEQVPEFTVDVEASPLKALQRLASNSYDAVVSDYQMPGLDGVQFLKTLRSQGNDIPFILLTGKGREEVAMEALNNGADYYLQKGVQVRPLFAELTNMLRRSVEHMRNGQAIKESEIKYRRLFNSSRDAIMVWRLDDESHLVDVNERACSLLEYSHNELLDMNRTVLLAPEYSDAGFAPKGPLIDKRETSVELTLVSRSGEMIPSMVKTNVVEIQGVGHAISIVLDQRERHRSEKEAKEREARFRAIFENSATGIALEDSDRRILECNQALGRTFHRKCEDLRGTIAYDLMDPERAKDDRIEFDHLMNGELDQYTRENQYRDKDGSAIWANVHFSRIRDNGRNLALAMVEDVTKKRQAENIQSSLYQISQATVSSPNLDALYGSIHQILSGLMPAKNFFIGLVADDNESMTFPYFVDERDPNPGRVCRCRTTSNYVIRTGKPLFMDKGLWAKLIAEGEIVPSGSLPIQWMGAPLKVGGRTIGVMVVQNYTGTVTYTNLDLDILMFVSDHVALAIDLKRSEEALRESERKVSTLMGNLPGMAYRCRNDREWTMEFVSEGCRILTGYPPQDLIGNKILSYKDLIHPEDRKLVSDEVTKGVDGRTQFHVEYRIMARDGAVRWVWERGCPVFDGAGGFVGLEGFITDVSMRKKAQEDVGLANRKLTLLGDLTRHDVLNRVTMLSGYLELINKNEKDEKLRRYAEKAAIAARSIGEQMEFIKEYQGVGIGEPEWVDMDPLVGRAVSKTDLGIIGISHDLEGLSVFADPMIEKVFCNLMENSVKHGMTVSRITITYLRGNDSVEIYFRDDGNGIPSDTKGQLFDRSYKRRLGHGMNFVQEVLRITGMEIDEIGLPGKGALFRIKVPTGCYRFKEEVSKSYMSDTSVIDQGRAEK